MVTDVFIAGGGPAGLAAAIAARMKGFGVVVADPARPPIDKACGEGLMPDAVAALNRLGVFLDKGYNFRGIRFLGDGVAASATFPHGSGVGVRRTALHQMLFERAVELGAELRWGSRVSGIREGKAEVDGQTVECRWLVGADGQQSKVRRWAGLDKTRRESKRFGFRRHYRVRPWTDCVEVHWGAKCQVYVTPVGAEEVGIALVSRDPHWRLDAALEAFPSLAKRLAGLECSSTERGAVSLSRTLRRVSTRRIALIGDASGSVDAITGEGLGLAFRQALALADALAAGSLASYEEAHRAIVRRASFMSSLLLLMDRSPWLQRRVLRALSGGPEIFNRLLAAHVGSIRQRETAFSAIEDTLIG